MNLAEFDRFVKNHLAIGDFARIDPSANGIQVGSALRPVRRVACAVDACMESFEAAAAWGADVLFVHHGIFWGREQRLVGDHFRRVRYLIDNDMALYAAHLPLDAHLTLGNNAGIARKLGLVDIEPFGLYKGIPVGVLGNFKPAVPRGRVAELLGLEDIEGSRKLSFGPQMVSSVGIVSGGAPREVAQAIDLGLDYFITGDALHDVYHRCKEARINVLFAGHYATEVFGVRSFAELVSQTSDLEARYFDLPTGL